jgi:hypothetical protein
LKKNFFLISKNILFNTLKCSILFALFLYPSISYSTSFYGLSGMLRIPSAYVGTGMSYYSMSGIHYYSYSKKMFLPNIEVGIKKRNGVDKSIFSAKIELLPDVSVIPALAIGVLDMNDPDVESSFFVTASKKITSLNAKIHAGFIKAGNYKDINLAKDIFNPASAINHFIQMGNDKKKYFFGLEKSIYNVINLMASYQSNNIVDTGIGISLMKFKVEYWKMDIKNREKLKDNSVVMFSTGYSF